MIKNRAGREMNRAKRKGISRYNDRTHERVALTGPFSSNSQVGTENSTNSSGVASDRLSR